MEYKFSRIYFLGNPVPPKTLNEAAQFSVCFSAAWDSKVKFICNSIHPNSFKSKAF